MWGGRAGGEVAGGGGGGLMTQGLLRAAASQPGGGGAGRAAPGRGSPHGRPSGIKAYGSHTEEVPEAHLPVTVSP